MAAPPTTRAANEGGGGAWKEEGGGAGARRLATAALFLAAVALPCLVLYRAVAPAGVLVQPAALMPWATQQQTAGAPPHDGLFVDDLQVRTCIYVRGNETLSFLYGFVVSTIKSWVASRSRHAAVLGQ